MNSHPLVPLVNRSYPTSFIGQNKLVQRDKLMNQDPILELYPLASFFFSFEPHLAHGSSSSFHLKVTTNMGCWDLFMSVLSTPRTFLVPSARTPKTRRILPIDLHQPFSIVVARVYSADRRERPFCNLNLPSKPYQRALKTILCFSRMSWS